ncbi:hypothetical protein L3X38_040271 [Prunus dulcis]|uniref:Reverse transcriptase zinc-binding domain-containing protein n=1 Tax=Prunus dulcis TaxID=3755 RepID=A0AAD4V9T8_PRUDU|nr:hypothetical protein L3X38_040271 [Prunus dulcis]
MEKGITPTSQSAQPKEAAATRILSRRWRLDENILNQEGRKYVNWVNRVLEQHKGQSIERFRRVQVLQLDLLAEWVNYSPYDYAFPYKLLAMENGSASKHQFSGFPSLGSGGYYNNNINIGFKSLKVIRFRHVAVTGELVEFLLSNCPLLERVSLTNFHPVFASRYFPDCDFLDAKIGARPSWIWSSLLEGRDSILCKTRKLVLSGEQTHKWRDNWLHGFCVIRPTTPVAPSAPQLVCEIMDIAESTWRLDSIRGFIDWKTVRAIMATPIGGSNLSDKIIWPWTSNGTYSVKSGYHSLHSANRMFYSGSSHFSVSVPDLVWKSLWKIRTLPKIRHFLWRTVANALPTKLNLFRRKIAPDPLCPLCEEVDLQKFTTIACWLNGVFDYQRWSKNERDWALSLIGFITREIWKSRCKAVFKGGAPEPIGLLARADRAAKEFLDANILPLHHHPSLPTLDSDSVWFPPPSRVYILLLKTDFYVKTCKRFDGIGSRKANRAAHKAASIGYEALELKSWAYQPPQSLVHVLVSDGLPCPPSDYV